MWSPSCTKGVGNSPFLHASSCPRRSSSCPQQGSWHLTRLVSSSHLTGGTTVPEAPTATPHTLHSLWGTQGRREEAGRGQSPQPGQRSRLGWAEVGRRKREGQGLGPMTKGRTHYSGQPRQGAAGEAGPRAPRKAAAAALELVRVSRRPPKPRSPALSHRSQCVSSRVRASLEATHCLPSCTLSLDLASDHVPPTVLTPTPALCLSTTVIRHPQPCAVPC